MLADEIIASPLFRRLGWGHGQLVHDLRQAHRFELDQDFTAAADELANSKPSAFIKSLPLCRLPHEVCWIETAQSYRPRFNSAHNDQSRPIKRIGLMVREDPETKVWLCAIAWSFHGGAMGLSPTMVALDTQSSAEALAHPKSAMFRSRSFGPSAEPEDLRGKGWQVNDENMAAVDRLTAMMAVLPSAYHRDRYRELKARGGTRAVDQLVSDCIPDWSAEPMFWMAVVAMLNSRNASSIEPGPDVSKLNKARQKRRQEELLTFSVCKIAPKLKARIVSERSTIGAPAGVRAHFVRGHFKIRSSGVFWWSPFLRGDKRLGFADKDYQLVGGQQQ